MQLGSNPSSECICNSLSQLFLRKPYPGTLSSTGKGVGPQAY